MEPFGFLILGENHYFFFLPLSILFFLLGGGNAGGGIDFWFKAGFSRGCLDLQMEVKNITPTRKADGLRPFF